MALEDKDGVGGQEPTVLKTGFTLKYLSKQAGNRYSSAAYFDRQDKNFLLNLVTYGSIAEENLRWHSIDFFYDYHPDMQYSDLVMAFNTSGELKRFKLVYDNGRREKHFSQHSLAEANKFILGSPEWFGGKFTLQIPEPEKVRDWAKQIETHWGKLDPQSLREMTRVNQGLLQIVKPVLI